MLGLLGRPVASLLGLPADRRAEVSVGVVVVSAVAGALVWPPLGAVAAMASILLARRAAARRAAGQREAVLDELPDVIDLLHLAVAAGTNPSLAVAAVAERGPPRARVALAELARRRALGEPLAHAAKVLTDQLGEEARPLAQALVGAERDGAPLLPALDRLAVEAAAARRRRAEERARQVPVRLLAPLVLCALPAVALLTVVPVLLTTLGRLTR